MPLPLAGIIAGVNAAGGIFNTISAGVQNRKNRKWAEKRYNIERADALHDWHMQNAYDSPAQQMERLKAAGLNPNLVYGHGADAQSQGSVRNSDTQTPDISVPRFEFDAMSYIDATMRQAQTDNLAEAAKVAQQQQNLIAAQTLKTLADTDETKLDTETKQQLQSYQVEMAKLMNNKVRDETSLINATYNEKQFAIDFLERSLDSRVENALQEVLEKKARIKLTDAQVKILESDKSLKEIEIALRRKGINPNDPSYIKIVVGALQALLKKIGLDYTEILK